MRDGGSVSSAMMEKKSNARAPGAGPVVRSGTLEPPSWLQLVVCEPAEKMS